MTDPDPDPDPDPAAGQPPGHGSPDDGDPMDLFGTLDMTDLQSLLDAARESDEAAGDPLGEDAVEATLSGAWRVLSPPEMAGLAADGLAPGPGLGYWMGCFRPAEMDDFSLPGAAAACRRLASWAQATELAVVAEVAARTAARDEKVPVGPDRRPARVPDEAAAEVALALRMSQFGATCWTDLAVTLAWRLTGTSAALHDGRIDLSRARLIAEVTSVLDDRGARLAEDKILPDAGSKTLGQLRAALRRAVITVDPQAAERRREGAERKARVGLYGDEEGTATLSGQNLPGVRAAAAMARITALARALKASGAAGGIDLLRAQVFVGLLLGTLPLIPPADDAPPGPPDDGPVDPADDVPPGPPGDAPPTRLMTARAARLPDRARENHRPPPAGADCLADPPAKDPATGPAPGPQIPGTAWTIRQTLTIPATHVMSVTHVIPMSSTTPMISARTPVAGARYGFRPGPGCRGPGRFRPGSPSPGPEPWPGYRAVRLAPARLAPARSALARLVPGWSALLCPGGPWPGSRRSLASSAGLVRLRRGRPAISPRRRPVTTALSGR